MPILAVIQLWHLDTGADEDGLYDAEELIDVGWRGSGCRRPLIEPAGWGASGANPWKRGRDLVWLEVL
jgi:hypothetical protein